MVDPCEGLRGRGEMEVLVEREAVALLRRCAKTCSLGWDEALGFASVKKQGNTDRFDRFKKVFSWA